MIGYADREGKEMKDIPQKFKGKIYFYWWTEFGGYLMPSTNPPKLMSEKFVPLGETNDLTVDFCDPDPPVEATVESLKAQIEKYRAESQRRIDILQGRLQELLALEVQS